jgi:hypothetical protein
MTTVQRWTRGISGAIGAILVLALFDYFFPPAPIDRYQYYFLIGGACLLGYLGGSKDERKSNRIHLAAER